jgi:hypothetical protein
LCRIHHDALSVIAGPIQYFEDHITTERRTETAILQEIMIRCNNMSLWRRVLMSSTARRHCFSTSDWTVHSETGIVSHQNQPLFQTIIGMEIHAQLDIPTKLFSSAPRCVDIISAKPNQAVWPLDVAVPGTLPRCSLEAVQAAILTAAACGCEISHKSRFERKHYAYADLPLGYQITQQRWPIAKQGLLKCRRKVDPKMKQKKRKEPFVTVGIDRIQLEQDTGKTIAVTKREVSTARDCEIGSGLEITLSGCLYIVRRMHFYYSWARMERNKS